MNKISRVSIIIPFFNRKNYLAQTLMSIRAEVIEKEIILVDDASQDDWRDSVILDPKDHLITLTKNIGPGAARNRGVANAKGDYIYFFDSDDLLVPNGLRQLVDYLDTNPMECAVGGRIASVIDDVGNQIGSAIAERYCAPPPLDRLTIDYLHRGGEFSGGLWLFLFRRALISRLGPMDECHWGTEDREYLLSILKVTSIPIINVPVAHRRIHESNLVMEKKNIGQFNLKQKQVAQNLLNLLSSKSEVKT